MASTRYEGLEVSEDMDFERRERRFQRVGKIALVVFLLLAFLGFTGSGPLSNASASSSDGLLSVTYERFDRINSPSTLQIDFDPSLVTGGELEVWLESSFIDRVRLEQITPEPDSVEVDSQRYVFTFAVSTESSPAPVAIQFQPERPGISRVTVGIVDGPELSLRQFVFP